MRIRPAAKVYLKGAALGFSCALCFAAAYGQSNKFQPGANPVSNQGYTGQVAVVGTAFSQVSRALWVGDTVACSITVTMNGGGSLTFQNVLDQWMPIQATIMSASTCAAGTVIAIY